MKRLNLGLKSWPTYSHEAPLLYLSFIIAAQRLSRRYLAIAVLLASRAATSRKPLVFGEILAEEESAAVEASL